VSARARKEAVFRISVRR